VKWRGIITEIGGKNQGVDNGRQPPHLNQVNTSYPVKNFKGGASPIRSTQKGRVPPQENFAEGKNFDRELASTTKEGAYSRLRKTTFFQNKGLFLCKKHREAGTLKQTGPE